MTSILFQRKMLFTSRKKYIYNSSGQTWFFFFLVVDGKFIGLSFLDHLFHWFWSEISSALNITLWNFIGVISIHNVSASVLWSDNWWYRQNMCTLLFPGDLYFHVSVRVYLTSFLTIFLPSCTGLCIIFSFELLCIEIHSFGWSEVLAEMLLQ